MAEIMEVGKDAEKKMKKLTDKVVKKFKERPVFYTALGVVVVFALYKLFSSGDENYTAEEDVVTNAYVPVGYDGYPTLSDSMLEDYNSIISGGTGTGSTVGGTTSSGTVNGEGSSYVEDSFIFDTGYDESYYKELEQQNAALLQQMGVLEEQMWAYEQDVLAHEFSFTEDGELYNGLGDLIYSPTGTYKVLFSGEAGYEQQMALETEANKAWRNSVLSQMQSNSAAYANAKTAEEKAALHSANAQLAKGLGLTYNSSTGKWLNPDGSEAWNYSNSSKNTVTTNSSKPITTTTGSSSYAGISYDKNTDYAALINKAKSEGASQSVIDTLTAQRNAKIAGENLNSDGSKKTATSGSSWGGTSTTTTKSSSGKTVTTGGGGGSISSTTKTSGTVNPTTTVTYDKNKDYAQAIKDAKASGASQATINALQAQREAKIKGENLNSDGTKKK